MWHEDVSTEVAAIMTVDGFVESTAGLAAGDLVGLVLHATPFYAEQGGQVFDTGLIAAADGAALLPVEGVQVRNPSRRTRPRSA